MDALVDSQDYKPKKVLVWLKPSCLSETELLLKCEGVPFVLERRGDVFVFEVNEHKKHGGLTQDQINEFLNDPNRH